MIPDGKKGNSLHCDCICEYICHFAHQFVWDSYHILGFDCELNKRLQFGHILCVGKCVCVCMLSSCMHIYCINVEYIFIAKLIYIHS